MEISRPQSPEVCRCKSGDLGLDRFRLFIEYHSIEPSVIWEDQTQIQADTMIARIGSVIGYGMSEEESRIIAGFTPDTRHLKIQDFHPYGIWTHKQTCQDLQFRGIGWKHKKETNHQVLKSKRPHTAIMSSNKSKLFAGSKQKMQKSDACFLNQISGTKSQALACKNQRSRLYINEKSLQSQVVENCLDKKWEYLIKVGEINSWARNLQIISKRCKAIQNERKPSEQNQSQGSCEASQLSNPYNRPAKYYRIDDHFNEFRIVYTNSDGEEESMPLKVFDQRYQAERKKHLPMEKGKNNMKGTIMMMLDAKQKFTKQKLNEKVWQRDQELNYILIEIMRMKSVLEQQQQVLRQCEIN